MATSIMERYLVTYTICYTVKRFRVLQKTIPAAVDFAKQSWKKEASVLDSVHTVTWALAH